MSLQGEEETPVSSRSMLTEEGPLENTASLQAKKRVPTPSQPWQLDLGLLTFRTMQK